ncbi:hypothetical protein [Agromyces sp. H66]|uniref:hypothetical protein n=1 Tax=Agromyces sp. H66 TaxID=2529859 RepID=UPI0010AA4AFD|nr:hypothetical protein [Agromyces sp. H66]
MLTIHEARAALERHFAEHPPLLTGELYISPEWHEDATDYLPTWGAREFLVEGRDAFSRWDNLVIFVDKETGEVREDTYTLHVRKIAQMTPVVASE